MRRVGVVDANPAQTLFLYCYRPNNSVAVNSSEILWIRDDDILLSKSKDGAEKRANDVRIAIDSLNILYLTDVTKDEEGTYSCFDNGLPMVKFLIRIEPNNLIFTKGETLTGTLFVLLSRWG